MEIVEYAGDGYRRMVDGPKWTVASLNYAARFDEANFSILERHLLTDEVFVLLTGKATLVIGEECKRVPMEPIKAYNVKAGEWHHIFVEPDTRVLVIENSDTSKENSEYKTVR